jgi:hypothetical protein
MARRPPSPSSIRSQLRSAQQKFERDVNSAVRKAERDMKQGLAAAERQARSDLEAEARRGQQRLDAQARRSPMVSHSVAERRYLEEVRDVVERDEAEVGRERDLFLCHAWEDRRLAARELFDAFDDLGVDAWFSEEHLELGSSLPRQLDRGIARSRVGVVLVTPAMLNALRRGGFADQELGALLSTGRVIPVLHEVSYEELSGESPLLAQRAGLSTTDSSLREVAEKIADNVL